MTALPVSVVIVSRGRPAALDLCLTGVAQLDHPAFEVVVVACPEGAKAVEARPDRRHIKLLRFDEANISAARNLGISRAAGEIVAFVDDDAVPEPLWLRHLCAPFADPEVASSGGYVRGRNGISYQWRGRMICRDLRETELALDGPGPHFPQAPHGSAVKLQGTNMAHRRDLIAQMGGFDPAFRFYLDETDLDLRHAAAGHRVAVTPLAQVHHGYAASARRGADRMPRDLSEIGASIHAFLLRHCPPPERPTAKARQREAQRRRLLGWMQRGPLGPDDQWRLMRGFDHGLREGAARPVAQLPPIPPSTTAFLPYPGRPDAPRTTLSGSLRQCAALRSEAARRARAGEIVSLYLFSRTTLYHQLRFAEGGYWEQRGGLYGRSDRSGKFLQICRFSDRVEKEDSRISGVRGPFGDFPLHSG